VTGFDSRRFWLGPPRGLSARRVRAIGFAIVVATLTTACAGSTATSAPATSGPITSAAPVSAAPATPVVGDTLTFAYQAAPNSLDPGKVNQAFAQYIMPAYDPLIIKNLAGEYTPGLALSWKYTDLTNTTFEITLRDNVTFSDGAKLDAAGLKKFFEYVQKAGGAQAAFFAGQTYEVTSPLVLTMHLAGPNPIMPEVLDQIWAIGYPISPKALDNPDALGTSTAGAGQYVLDAGQTVAGDHYVYTASKTYWNPTAIHYKKVVIKVIANPNSTLQAMQTGQVDVAVGDYTTVSGAKSAGLQVFAVPTIWQGLGLLDRGGTMSKPLADVRVRQAINFAIDRKTITAALYGEYGIPSAQIQVPGGDGYDASLENYYDYNPAKAKELLAAAGYADGFELPVLSTQLANIGLAAQAIVDNLAAVGIKLKLVTAADVNAYIGDLFGAKYPAAALGLGTQPIWLAGPIEFLPTATFNPFKTNDPELIALYSQAATSTAADRAVLDRKIVGRILTEAWFAPIGYSPVFTYATTKVAGAEVSAQTPFPIFGSLAPKP
jgi:peptide/nickel transport system substrate-binding protein